MIENNPISPLSSKPTEEVRLKDKKTHLIEQQSRDKGHDKVELSDTARVLSRATSALNNETEVEDERVRMVTQQVQDGIYQVPVDKLASALLERLFRSK